MIGVGTIDSEPLESASIGLSTRLAGDGHLSILQCDGLGASTEASPCQPVGGLPAVGLAQVGFRGLRSTPTTIPSWAMQIRLEQPGAIGDSACVSGEMTEGPTAVASEKTRDNREIT